MINPIRELAALPMIELLGWTLIHSLWQATLVSVIVAAALRVLRNSTPNARYVSSCIGLLFVAAAPVITFVCLAVVTVAVPTPSVVLTAPVMGGPDSNPMDSSKEQRYQIPDANNQRLTEQASGFPSVQSSNGREFETRVAQQSAVLALDGTITRAAPWIVTAWLLGVGMLSIWHMAGWMLARRLTIRGTRPVTLQIQLMLEALMERMQIRVSVRVLESTVTAVPILVGWLKPVLLLPASLLSGLPPEHIQAILAHELAHVRRHDFLVNILQTIVETCLFYHPAMWWMSGQIRIEREYCADEEAAAICEDRCTYARALVSLADLVRGVPSLAVAATGGSLTRRIHRVLGLPSGFPRPTRRPAWLVSVFLGLAVIYGLITSTSSNAQHLAQVSQDQADPNHADPNQSHVETTPIEEIVSRVIPTLKGWTLHEYDKQPSVVVDRYRGFRIVLRRTWKKFTNPGQQAARPRGPEDPFELRHEDWEFVLIPVRPQTAPVAIKSQIKWQNSTSPYYTRDICLGEGHGYMWFTRGTLYGQEFARETYNLQGGDDRIQLWIDGLRVEDLNTNTANSCLYRGQKFGDQALPYIEKAIEQAREGDDLWRVVGSLRIIQSDRSTELLIKLFDSKQDKIKRAAEYALIHQPYRKAAKQAYFDMLRRHSSVDRACQACVEFKWQDAVPILQDMIANPDNLAELKSTIPARRTLEGQSITQELLDTEGTIRGLVAHNRTPEQQMKIDAARNLLIQTKDSETANLIAVTLAVMTTKGNATPVNDAAIEILQSRPRQSTVAFLKSLAAGIHEEHRPKVQKLLDMVQNAPKPDQP